MDDTTSLVLVCRRDRTRRRPLITMQMIRASEMVMEKRISIMLHLVLRNVLQSPPVPHLPTFRWLSGRGFSFEPPAGINKLLPTLDNGWVADPWFFYEAGFSPGHCLCGCFRRLDCHLAGDDRADIPFIVNGPVDGA